MKKYIVIILTLIYFSGCCGNCDEQQNIKLPWYQPNINTSWQWQLSGDINTSYDVELYDIDLFDTPQATIDELHKKDKKVICYFSAGSYEDWRSDKSKFPNSLKGKDLDGWAGEKWLNISKLDLLKPIMDARFDLAKSKKCDGVEPDNVDGYTNDTGFPLSANDQLKYNKYLASAAHKRGLSIALKNDIDQIIQLEPFFDFAVNEQCNQYNECGNYTAFTSNNKAVLNAEYADGTVDTTINIDYVHNQHERDTMCSTAISNNLRTLVLPLDLNDSFRIPCD